MILGIGCDIIESERIERLLTETEKIDRIFTESERKYCDGKGKERSASYAARFAAKEAAAKATDFRCNQGIPFLHLPYEDAQLALVYGLHSGYCFLDVLVDFELPRLAKIVNFKTLVFYCLFVSADPDVCVYHKTIFGVLNMQHIKGNLFGRNGCD